MTSNLLIMRNILLFGATGNVGKAIARELHQQSTFTVTAVVRNQERAAGLKNIVSETIVADVTKHALLNSLCSGFDIVISALGKSVSPNDKSKPSFQDIDLETNTHILNEAIKGGVKKFVYVSAFHAEKYLHLEYFRTHHEFSERLKHSGLDYSIIKPPAVFSAFLDLMAMAQKGLLITLGKGQRLTNPIYEGDLAKICVTSIDQPNTIIEAGGKETLSRSAINETIQRLVAPNKKVRTVPLGLIKASLPLVKVMDKNRYDKFAFFSEVMQHDTIAPAVGEMTLETYVKSKLSLLNR